MKTAARRLLAACLVAWVGSAAATAEVGVTEHEIVIGQSAPLSGPAALLGQQMKQGAEAYFKSVNDQGGVNGRKIRLVTLDDGYEPARTAANTKTLLDGERVFALFGYVGTPTSLEALPMVTERKVPFLAPLTGAQALRTPLNRYVFNVRAGYEDETRAIVKFVAGAGLSRIAVFYQNDAYGQAGLAGVQKALKGVTTEPLVTATVDRNSVDVAKAVATIRAANPQVVIMVSAYTSCAAFIKGMKAAGSTSQFWNVSFVGSNALAGELGPLGVGVAISQVVPFPWGDRMPMTLEHRRLVGDRQISFTTLEGFMAAKVFVEGLRRAGRNPTRESFRDALEAGKIDLGGFGVSFTPTNHSGSNFVDLTMVSRDGKFIR